MARPSTRGGRRRQASVAAPELQIVVAVAGGDLDPPRAARAQHVEADLHPDLAAAPELAVELRQAGDFLAVESEDHFAAAQAGLLGRAGGRDANHRDRPRRLGAVDAEPGPRRAGAASAR